MKFVADERKSHTVYPPADQVFTWTQMCDIRDVSLPDLESQVTHAASKHAWQNEDLLIGKLKDACKSQKDQNRLYAWLLKDGTLTGNARENKESRVSEAFGLNYVLLAVVGCVPVWSLLMCLFLGQSGDFGPGPLSWS